MGEREVVAKRQWKLTGYEVAGCAIKKLLRPGGTPDFRRPVFVPEVPSLDFERAGVRCSLI